MAKLVTKTVEKKSGLLDKLENRKWILPAVFSIIIFVMAIWGIENFNQLLLYDDEFGYWAASAYLTGTDWTSVTSGIPYYSYGYGFLILTPIRLFFDNTETMYQAAIVINALLLVGSYWIARNVTKQLFEKAHWVLIDTVCFVVMLYPSNMVFSHIAWAECLLVFVFWVFVWLSLRVVKKPTLWNHLGVAITIVYLYAVHQRSLAIIIATVMMMIYYCIEDKKRRMNIVVFLLGLGVFMVLHHFVKEDILSQFYNNNNKVALNDFQGQTEKLQTAFSFAGAGKLFFSIIGKWFYLVVATGFTMWWAMETFFGNALSWIKGFQTKSKVGRENQILNKKKIVFSTDSGEERCFICEWYVWLLLAFLGNFMVCAIYMIDVTRQDTLIYGRYNEYMIGIYCIIGFFTFLKDQRWLKKTCIYIVLVLVAGWLCQIVLEQVGSTSYQAYHSVCTSWYFLKGQKTSSEVLAYAVAGIAVATCIMQLVKAQNWKRFNWIKLVSAVLIIVLVYSGVAYPLILGRMTEKQVLRVTNIRTIINWIDKIDEEANIYYLSDTESRYWSESFQFLLGERPLEVTNSGKLSEKEDAYYITGDNFVDSTGFEENYYCIKRTNQFALIVQADGELAEKAMSLKN